MRCTSDTSTSPSPTRTSPSACPPRSDSRTASTRSPSATAPPAPAKSVALVGTFTDWKERPLAMTGPDARGTYATTIVLAKVNYHLHALERTGWCGWPRNASGAG